MTYTSQLDKQVERIFVPGRKMMPPKMLPDYASNFAKALPKTRGVAAMGHFVVIASGGDQPIL